jgi:glycosyltransferase involved in cell wall biosynthesis
MKLPGFFRRYLARHPIFWRSGRRPLCILAVGDGDIASIELCLRIPLEWMSMTLGIKYRLIYAPDLPRTPGDNIDLVMMMRVCDKRSLAFARSLKGKGIPYIYMMDDDLDLIDPETPLGAMLMAIDARNNIATLAELASAVVVFSEALRDKFFRYNSETSILVAPSGLLRSLKRSAPPCPSPELRMGFAGGTVHADNLSMVENVIGDLLEANPALVFETIGQQSPGLAGHPRYRHFPFVHDGIDAFFQLLHSRTWDIGLAPLRDTAFNAAKTDNKYRTYASAGIPAVYSKVAPFNLSVRDRETGLLVDNNAEAWRNAIDLLLTDGSLRQSMAQSAAFDADQRFNLAAVCLEYLRIIVSVMEKPESRGVLSAAQAVQGA